MKPSRRISGRFYRVTLDNGATLRARWDTRDRQWWAANANGTWRNVRGVVKWEEVT